MAVERQNSNEKKYIVRENDHPIRSGLETRRAAACNLPWNGEIAATRGRLENDQDMDLHTAKGFATGEPRGR